MPFGLGGHCNMPGLERTSSQMVRPERRERQPEKGVGAGELASCSLLPAAVTSGLEANRAGCCSVQLSHTTYGAWVAPTGHVAATKICHAVCSGEAESLVGKRHAFEARDALVSA